MRTGAFLVFAVLVQALCAAEQTELLVLFDFSGSFDVREEIKVSGTNGTVTFFSLLAHNVTTRTVDFIASIKR